MSDLSADISDDVEIEDVAAEPSASTITFSLPSGLYAFKVKSGGATERDSSLPALPAVKVDLAPGIQEATVDFLSAPTTHHNYLAYHDDAVVVRVAGGAALFMLVSLQMPGQDALALDIARLDIPTPADEPPVNYIAEFVPDWTEAPEGATDDGRLLASELTIDLPSGDRLTFADGWACSLEDMQAIEAFTITPSDSAAAELLEYNAIVEGQASSDWRAAGTVCGIPGSNVPLQGYAVRTKPGTDPFYDCYYFGVFASGLVVGPLSDGALCASETPADPLVRMDVRLVARPSSV